MLAGFVLEIAAATLVKEPQGAQVVVPKKAVLKTRVRCRLP
jgi:hypothetical protein